MKFSNGYHTHLILIKCHASIMYYLPSIPSQRQRALLFSMSRKFTAKKFAINVIVEKGSNRKFQLYYEK